MLVHQLLRIINKDIPIVFFDLKENILYSYLNKNDININLYEEEVFQVSCGTYHVDPRKIALHIMIRK